MLINGTAGTSTLGSPNSGGACCTIMVVSGDVSGDSADCNGGNVILVNGSVSSVDSPFDGGTSIGANGIVGSVEPSGTSVGDVSVLMFVLSMFDVRDVSMVVVTLNKGGFNGTVVVVALLVSRVVTFSGTFAVVIIFVATGTVAMLITAASIAMSKSLT